jgi:hypothetical protein
MFLSDYGLVVNTDICKLPLQHSSRVEVEQIKSTKATGEVAMDNRKVKKKRCNTRVLKSGSRPMQDILRNSIL